MSRIFHQFNLSILKPFSIFFYEIFGIAGHERDVPSHELRGFIFNDSIV